MRQCSLIHPATRIVLWLLLAAAIGRLQATELLPVSALLALPLVVVRGNHFLRLMRRSRWLLLALAAIYAFASPGEPLFEGLAGIGPTREGLIAGALQAWRLTILIGALALLAATSTRDELLGGLYVLLRPWRWIGVDAERIAVRLWLTLHYAETVAVPKFQDWRYAFDAAPGASGGSVEAIAIESHPVTWRDLVTVVLGVATTGTLYL